MSDLIWPKYQIHDKSVVGHWKLNNDCLKTGDSLFHTIGHSIDIAVYANNGMSVIKWNAYYTTRSWKIYEASLMY